MKFYNQYRHKLGIVALVLVMIAQYASHLETAAVSTMQFASLEFGTDFKRVDSTDPNLNELESDNFDVDIVDGGTKKGRASVQVRIGTTQSANGGLVQACEAFSKKSFPDGSSYKSMSQNERLTTCLNNLELKKSGNQTGIQWVEENLKPEKKPMATVEIKLDRDAQKISCSFGKCNTDTLIFEVASTNMKDIQDAIKAALGNFDTTPPAPESKCNADTGNADRDDRANLKCMQREYKRLAAQCRKDFRAHRPKHRNRDFHDDIDTDTLPASCNDAEFYFQEMEPLLIAQVKKDPEAAQSMLANLLDATPKCDATQAKADNCPMVEPLVGLLSLDMTAEVRKYKDTYSMLANLKPGERIPREYLASVRELINSSRGYEARQRLILGLGHRTSLNVASIKLAFNKNLDPYSFKQIGCFARLRTGAGVPYSSDCNFSDQTDPHDPFDGADTANNFLAELNDSPSDMNVGPFKRYDDLNLGTETVSRINNVRSNPFDGGDRSLLNYSSFYPRSGVTTSDTNRDAINNNRSRGLGSGSILSL